MRLKGDVPEEFLDIDDLKAKNPFLWKKLKKRFYTGRQIVEIQLNNGINKLNEKTLRSYLWEYVHRFLKYGPHSFPLSFNVFEPFFIFNQYNSIIQLVNEEESYGISLLDFLDFVTDSNLDISKIDLFENIPDKLIYHFTFTDFEDYNFSNDGGETFLISSLSMIRQGNEVSMLMQSGESFDTKFVEDYFRNKSRESLEMGLTHKKKSLGLKIESDEEPKVVNLEGRDDLWLHNVGVLFDLEKRSIDIRHIARDENINYSIITDDFYSIFKEESHLADKNCEYIENQIKELDRYSAVFDFSKFCLLLPYYVFENEQRLVEVTYQTSIGDLIKGPSTKRKYSTVPGTYKLHARPFYFIESSTQIVFEPRVINDDSFKIEKSGYWKRIGIDEVGFDKKGRKIIGKTWVERNDVYYSNKKGVTRVKESLLFNGKNAGYLYVMRQPTQEENIFKVGLTKRNVDQRKKELSNTSSPDNYFVITSYQTKDCVEAEKQVHAALQNYRLSSRREFFRCELRIILETCEEIVNVINKSDL